MGIEGFLKDFAIEALGEAFGGGASEMKTIKEVPVFAPGSEVVVRDALRANEVGELQEKHFKFGRSGLAIIGGEWGGETDKADVVASAESLDFNKCSRPCQTSLLVILLL